MPPEEPITNQPPPTTDPTPPHTTDPAPDPADDDDDLPETLDRDAFQKALNARVNAERKRLAKQYGDYDELKKQADKLKEIENASKSETERALADANASREKAEKAEQAARASALKLAVVAAATKKGMKDPTDAFRLLDLDALEIADGAVAGLDEALDALAIEKKYLFGRTVPDTQAPNPPKGGATPERTDLDRARDYFGGGGFDFFRPPS